MAEMEEKPVGEYQVGGTLAISRRDFYRYRDRFVKEMIAVAEAPEWNENLRGFYLGKYENKYGSVVYIVGDSPAPLKESVREEFGEAS